MKLRTMLAPALLSALALAPLAATTSATATAPPGGDASAQADDPAGDAPDPVDITNVHVFKTTEDYRAVVTFTDLTPRNATRWFVEFLDFGNVDRTQRTQARRDAALGVPPTGSANMVELRRSPGGKESSFGYKINSSNSSNGQVGGPVQRATCSLPQTATPNYAANTITYVVPRRCWKPTSGNVLVFAGASQYDADTYDGTTYPAQTSGENDSDVFGWSYRTTTTPSPSATP